MTEQESAADRKPEALTIMCGECQEMVEVHDPRMVLLAAHLAAHCSGTTDILHA